VVAILAVASGAGGLVSIAVWLVEALAKNRLSRRLVWKHIPNDFKSINQ